MICDVGSLFTLRVETKCEPLQVAVDTLQENEQSVARAHCIFLCAQKVTELGSRGVSPFLTCITDCDSQTPCEPPRVARDLKGQHGCPPVLTPKTT